MPDREYWRKRYLKDKARAVNAAEDFIRKDTKKYYMQAAKEIQADIEKFYKKYAAENGITLSEAKRRISQAEFAGIDWEQLCRNESELDRELKKKKDSLPGDVVARMERERMEYENRIKTLSAKGNITRMELLQAEIDKAVLELQDAQQINIFDLLRNEYEDGYYHGMYSMQQCMGFGYDFAAVNTRAVEKAVLNPRRSNYSKTIYKHQKNLKKELTECLTVGMIKGEGIDKTIGRVQRRLEVSHSNARRLVRTETAYIYEQAMLDVYTECGITEYEYLATLDKKTSEICQELDGKRFKIADALPGTNYPPMHPNCRSTTAAAFDDDVPSRRAARDDAGKYYTVPSDMTYKDWEKAHVPVKTVEESGEHGIIKEKSCLETKVERLLDGTDTDRKSLGEEILKDYGVESIPVNIKDMSSNGYCSILVKNDTLVVTDYNLNVNDKRSAKYQVKTAFHEAYHASGNGYDTDLSEKNSARWLDFEETFAETSAHYKASLYGITDLTPAYADKLVSVLPRLKQLPEFSGCTKLIDFGKIALEARQNGGGSKWVQLSKTAMRKKFSYCDYTAQYFPEIRSDIDGYVDKILENMPDSKKYRENMITNLEKAMDHIDEFGQTLSDSELRMLNNAVAVAMNRIGVK